MRGWRDLEQQGRKTMKELLTKIYVKLIGRRREYYSTAIEYKGSAYVITVEKYHTKEDFIQSFYSDAATSCKESIRL